jgi:hypothetical protein
MVAYLACPSVPLCAMLKIRACDHQVREDEARRRPNAEPRGKHVVSHTLSLFLVFFFKE